MDFIREMERRRKTCKHPKMFKCVPRGGTLWREACPDCAYMRDLTPEESAAEDKHLIASLRK